MAGSGNNQVTSELLQFATETEHEKIIRAISLAIAMIHIQQEEAAETTIEQLSFEKDPILRFGAVQTISMAYIGTANAKALEKLLKFASSDHNDDVRRAAVIGLSFVLINHTEQLPKLAQLFAVSYNPHVRYGTAIALGISYAGKQTPEALAILEELLKDPQDFVKQGAYLGLSMMLMQTTEQMEPKITKLKNDLKSIYEKKHEDSFNKMTAMISYGLLESGGRNCQITLTSRTKSLKIGSCASMLVFTHHWYWFPLIYFLPLTFTPSALIGVDKTLKIPTQFQFNCNCKPSLFAYPEKTEKDSKNQQKEQTVALSITAKAKARAQMKGNQKEDEKKEEKKEEKKDEEKKQEKKEEKKEEKEEKMEIEDKNKEQEEEKAKEKDKIEHKSYIITNPSRVLEKQEQYIQYIENQFEVIAKNRKRGIIFLLNKKPEEKITYFEIPAIGSSHKEPQHQQQQQPKPINLNPPDEFIFDEEAQK